MKSSWLDDINSPFPERNDLLCENRKLILLNAGYWVSSRAIVSHLGPLGLISGHWVSSRAIGSHVGPFQPSPKFHALP